jgi:phage tail protein X
MATITGFEIYEVATEFVTADLIVWKRYRRRCPGIVEIMMDANPQLAKSSKVSPFIPVGTFIRVPIDPNMLLGQPAPLPTDSLWTDKFGYRL